MTSLKGPDMEQWIMENPNTLLAGAVLLLLLCVVVEFKDEIKLKVRALFRVKCLKG